MKLLKHGLKNYRNIENLYFEPTDGVNVICGENGQGKTNLLESVFLLSGAKSFRGGKDENLIKDFTEGAVIDSEFFAEGRTQTLKIKIDEKGRNASLNGGSYAKAASNAGKFCCVVFSPEHLSLVKGSPDQRRRLIDTALCQISAGYLASLKKYKRLLTQKNSLLKDVRYISAANDMLDVYDAGIAKEAAEITKKRRAYISKMAVIATQKYAEISDNREPLSFSYFSTMFETEEYESGFDRLVRARGEDIKLGFSSIGPHRDELEIKLKHSDSKQYASQGQQRCIVLSLKLAEAEIMESALEEKPVLLLDDVMSELDESRRDYLVKSLSGCQTVITCCAPELVCDRTAAKVFFMRDGSLSLEG